jgi:hypothetical protein
VYVLQESVFYVDRTKKFYTNTDTDNHDGFMTGERWRWWKKEAQGEGVYTRLHRTCSITHRHNIPHIVFQDCTKVLHIDTQSMD